MTNYCFSLLLLSSHSVQLSRCVHWQQLYLHHLIAVTDSGFKWCHSCKMASIVLWILCLDLCTVWGSGSTNFKYINSLSWFETIVVILSETTHSNRTVSIIYFSRDQECDCEIDRILPAAIFSMTVGDRQSSHNQSFTVTAVSEQENSVFVPYLLICDSPCEDVWHATKGYTATAAAELCLIGDHKDIGNINLSGAFFSPGKYAA